MADVVSMSDSSLPPVDQRDAAAPAGREAAREAVSAGDAGAAKPAGLAPSKPASAAMPKSPPGTKPPFTARSPLTAKPAPVVPAPGRGGPRLFTALCAVLSLAGATVALTAPALRPQAFDLARAWLGEDSPAARYLAPPSAEPAAPVPAPLTYTPPAFQAPASPPGDTSLEAAALAAVRAEMIATLRLELDGVRRAAAEQGDRLKAVGASVQAVQADTATVRGEARAAAAAADAAANAQAASARALEASSRALDGVRDRLDRVETLVAAFDGRVRATGLVVAAAQLRRDIDAGAPLGDDLAAVASSGSLPPPVQQALDQLFRFERGVPTLRELGVGFDQLDAEIVARGGGQGSWLSLGAWFGSGNPQRDVLDRLRALATEGRFGEVADALERSEWASLAQRWGTLVRQRSAAAVAGQTVLTHALAAYEASQTTVQHGPS